ncbi:glycoside hydrolase family 2 TIM barrel-domain containing protein [Xylanibacter oryzae]|uniref:glycoside hydrolase family 2 TIM barrel-domain containing protein n=1 Tax=Xylanibacter oryzae TaxID=185293 RepID=UPI0004B634E2|nr:glycoside hydrolase family 2 TIM barrel-domain containing protein [Xylanibacter oryzae]
MKKTFLIIITILSALPMLAGGPREEKNIDFGWKFHLGDIPDAALSSYDDTDWRTVDLPHDFQIEQPWVAPDKNEKAGSDAANNTRSRLSGRGFKEMGIGWYRYSFTPDNTMKGKRVLIDFEGIMLVGDVYLNGERVGGTDYGYVGFDVDITDKLKYGQKNVIAVKADTRNPENSRWYTGGGLFRDVHMIITDPQLYFTRNSLCITTPVATSTEAVVKIQAEMAFNISKSQPLNVEVKIKDATGKIVADRTTKVSFSRAQKVCEHPLDSIVLTNPNLWSCESPYLYNAEVTLFRPDGTVADCINENFGARTIEYSPSFGFKLNGKKVLLKGIANHHTLGALGAAAYPRAIEKRLQLLKSFGFNHIRTSHNPYSKELLNLCDKYGILVVDELYDKWLTQFAGGREEWTNLWQIDVPEFIKRDRNHPSVVMWSLGNELQTYWDLPYADWGVTPYRMQRELLHRYDTTRPITVAMHPRGRSHTALGDSLPAPLALQTDVAAYNYRYMYFPGDGRRFPKMIFYQSEANAAMMGPNFFEMNLDKVVGLAYWGMIDYLGESQGWPAKGWSQGAFDISLEPKPMAYLLKSMFLDKPTVHIGVIEDGNSNLMWNDVQVGTTRMSESWNRKAGSTVSLYTYTNADEVELFLNGKSLGKKKNEIANPKQRDKIRWDNIPYAPGRLEAVAIKDGKIVARHEIETTGKAVALQVIPDNNNWKADGMDLQHVRIYAVDSKGRRVYDAQDQLNFSIDGDARIVAVSNGDIASDESMVGNSRRLYNGSALVIIRAGRKAGKVKLTTVSDKYRTVESKFATK